MKMIALSLSAMTAVLACSSVVQEAASGGTGSGGARGTDGGIVGTSPSSSSAASSSSSGQTADAGGGDGSVCEPGTEMSLCDPQCDVASGGACACDALHAPNCPMGWWKACCAGDGKPCDPPVYPDGGVEIIPACGPGAAPAWCVSWPYACHH